ncbi:MAG: DUF4405 domain-containing protein [Syntrophomonas sp.]
MNLSKTKSNFVIDAIMFLVMMFMTGTGFVRKFILLGGRASRESFGQKVEMSLMGMNRDSWSNIHLYAGYFLLFLLLLHIILHWKQINVMYKQLIAGRTMRMLIMVIFVIISVLLAVFPFILQPAVLQG